MLEFLFGWFLGETLATPETYVISRPEKQKECDYCSSAVDARLGSGLLCGHHYHTLGLYKETDPKLFEK